MLRIALGMLIVAGIAAFFGFGGIVSTVAAGAKTVFVVALALGVVLLVLALEGERRPR
jgi:uncharacterized membrane protein YtjA (UPF0391 family)